MAQPGDVEPSMSILERLLANAALRDEAGWLRRPEPRAQPPEGGLLGWAQKDLQSEFGIAADPHPSSFRPSSWSQDSSQDYGLGEASPRGDPDLGETDWAGKCGQGVGEGSATEWPSRRGISQEEIEVGSQDGSGASAPGGLTAQDWVTGKPAQIGTQQSQEADVQAWEFGKRDSQGTYSSRDVELQDREFGKRDSLGSYSSQDTSLQDWEFGKRDSLGTYASRDVTEQSPELGKEDHRGGYSSQDAGEQDQEFGKRDSLLGTYGSLSTEQPDQDFRSAWLGDYSGSGSPIALGPPDRGFGGRALSAGFSPEEAQQQDEEFEKKVPSGADSQGEASRDVGRPAERESRGSFGPSAAQSRDGAVEQRDQSSWQGSRASQDVGGPQGRQQAVGQGPDDADLQDREGEQRGWASDFRLGAVPQQDVTFSPGQRAWSGDFCVEAPGRSSQFGVIGNDRLSSASPSPAGKVGGGCFVPPEKALAGPVDWTDQLGLRNLEVSSCLGSGGSSEAREDAMGQMGWSDNLGLRDVDLASRLETGGSEEPRGIGVGEKAWTSDLGVGNRDLVGVGEVGGLSQARESGVGQTDWSGVEAGEFLKSRERGVGQADWTSDLGLRNVAPGAGGSPRELGAGQVDWGNNLGPRNLELPCDLESGGSLELRGCGVGQMDWTQDLGLHNMELSGALGEAREHGVGEVSQCLEPGLRDSGVLSPGLEARDPSEARGMRLGETSGPETQGEDDSSPSVETCPADLRMETGGAPSFGAR
ncbi:hypothetical protein MC885_006011 [Smutsia gigantea]|nr:hypothetical protein MC885_006011 [Smutsia gigantea]